MEEFIRLLNQHADIITGYVSGLMIECHHEPENRRLRLIGHLHDRIEEIRYDDSLINNWQITAEDMLRALVSALTRTVNQEVPIPREPGWYWIQVDGQSTLDGQLTLEIVQVLRTSRGYLSVRGSDVANIMARWWGPLMAPVIQPIINAQTQQPNIRESLDRASQTVRESLRYEVMLSEEELRRQYGIPSPVEDLEAAQRSYEISRDGTARTDIPAGAAVEPQDLSPTSRRVVST